MDLVFVYDKNYVYEKNLIFKIGQMTPLAKSDHNIINILLNINVKVTNKTIKSFNYNKADYKILENMITSVDWEDKKTSCNINEMWHLIIEI